VARSKRIVIVSEGPAEGFATRVEQLYTTDPYKLLSLVRSLQRFGVLDKNVALKAIVTWYLKGTFARRRSYKLLRSAPAALEQGYNELLETRRRIPPGLLAAEEWDTLNALLPESVS
jgi:hypothetical protein